MRQTILFDIDGTLFDHHILGRLTNEKLSSVCNIPIADIEQFDRVYQSKLKKESDYDAADWSTSFAQHFNKDEQEVKNIVFDLNVMKQCYYPEVVTVLDSLKHTHNLGIYSEGFNHFQLAKITPIKHYFNEKLIFIFRNKRIPDSIAQVPSDVLIIDNTVDVLEKLKSRSDIQKVWINRESEATNKEFQTIFSLQEILTT